MLQGPAWQSQRSKGYVPLQRDSHGLPWPLNYHPPAKLPVCAALREHVPTTPSYSLHRRRLECKHIRKCDNGGREMMFGGGLFMGLGLLIMLLVLALPLVLVGLVVALIARAAQGGGS
jgi:hypothetical protein